MKFILLMMLLASSSVFAVDCRALKVEAQQLNFKLQEIGESIIENQTILLEEEEKIIHATTNGLDVESLYVDYIALNFEGLVMRERYIEVEDRKFFVRIQRVRHCDLPTTYTKPRRNKKV